MLTGFLARVAQLLHACRWCGGAVAGNVEVADAVQEFSAFRKQAGGGMHATGALLAAGATDVMHLALFDGRPVVSDARRGAELALAVGVAGIGQAACRERVCQYG